LRDNRPIHASGVNGQDRTLNRFAAPMISVYSRRARLC
jgi:hypothetical protein